MSLHCLVLFCGSSTSEFDGNCSPSHAQRWERREHEASMSMQTGVCVAKCGKCRKKPRKLQPLWCLRVSITWVIYSDQSENKQHFFFTEYCYACVHIVGPALNQFSLFSLAPNMPPNNCTYSRHGGKITLTPPAADTSWLSFSAIFEPNWLLPRLHKCSNSVFCSPFKPIRD